ncbi:DNA mismatch repair protein MutS [Gimesia maris]|uniref:DNA mismatch repair protein MutS n=1 Tax=Gimesia maris TaxID=122 RepID=A0ABX5YPZ0_9PLAN|nr:DNA mismatch repair protein MutS [Gimesia maris]EDL60738.1 DNA mismatch repair protein [Gimesia maris DSM 8797]QDU15651.1 DNA mismatch repair protein MutS [Gimesia maris]QEG17678.1 DNA mismatch repair protein MutS [Gimesia maris]QGQ29275.1 DNA mismatch repair protein MutS [Gimesia maris]
MTKSGKKLTPMMERYLEVKRQNPGTLLLFRMGDFYELFHEDAEIAARILGITLTSRDKTSSNPIPMAGFPHHSLDNYLYKLIHAGYRASICDQVEDPKKAKGMVKREVTRVVTPGTLTDDALLDPHENNFLASIYFGKSNIGLAWLELSTGRFLTSNTTAEHLVDELARIHPAECIFAEGNTALQNAVGHLDTMLTERPPWSFAEGESEKRLLDHFGTKTLEGFNLEAGTPSITAAGALLEYVQDTQKSAIPHINQIEPYERGDRLLIDEATRRSLELTRTIREGKREGSLISVLDETVTSMGARLLTDWIANPLTSLSQIERRLDAVEELSQNPVLCTEVREQLAKTYDLQRLTARIATGRASARDLSFLAQTLALLPKLKAKLSGRKAELLQSLEADIDLCAEVRSDIETMIIEDPPLTLNEGGVIRPGFSEELDELRSLSKGGKEWIAGYRNEESERIGIPNLKVGYNKVFGYYLEVSAAHAAKVPDHYIRKQTLKNQERYITPELKEYEEKVLKAEDRAVELEQSMFDELRERVAKEAPRTQKTAEILAQIDVLFGLAHLATHAGYTRPEMTEEPVLDIRESRHPVLDRLQPSGEFVPNDVLLGEPYGRVQIITGPNMAGKSTYIRQAALLTLMAQIGSFIPASEARIGIADRIFARVGASDELSKGQSTFMVEMTEAARILNSASERSLVILDEIGRGTSTYDGISLAWSMTEFLHDKIKARTLFATHYHELTELTQTLKQASNWNVAVHEQDGEIVFLHKIVEGSANKSYGIHVARLAGIPDQVIQRANQILSTLEKDHIDETGQTTIPPRIDRKSSHQQLSLFGNTAHPVLDEIRDLNVDEMTPLAALEELYRIREQLN